MNLNFKSIFSQSLIIIKANIREILILSFIATFFVFQITKMVQLIEQIKDIPTILIAFLAAISPLLFLIFYLLLLFIIINKESGLDASYLKMIQYIITRLIAVTVTGLLNWLIVLFGYLLLIIPGFIWFFMYSQAYFFSLIDGMGPLQALRTSKIATNTSKRKLFNLYFLFGFIYGVPVFLLSILSKLLNLPDIVLTYIQVFGSYLLLTNNYVIWKVLKQNMKSQNPTYMENSKQENYSSRDKIRRIIDFLLIIYFIFQVMFDFFESLITLIFYINHKINMNLYTPMNLFVEGCIFIFIIVCLIQKKTNRYLYVMVGCLLAYLDITIYRLFFITNFHLNSIDINNALLFGIPFIISAFMNIKIKLNIFNRVSE